jgi:mRNA interferase MazF
MQRGEIWLIDLEPARGTEANKRRPAIIVSNNGANTSAATFSRGVVTVVPVISNVERIYPFQVRLRAEATGLPRDSKAQAEQVRSVDVNRLHARIGAVPVQTMLELDDALRLHLAL